MAKDGTNRGGARPGAGRPRKALTEKIAEGKSAEVMMLSVFFRIYISEGSIGCLNTRFCA